MFQHQQSGVRFVDGLYVVQTLFVDIGGGPTTTELGSALNWTAPYELFDTRAEMSTLEDGAPVAGPLRVHTRASFITPTDMTLAAGQRLTIEVASTHERRRSLVITGVVRDPVRTLIRRFRYGDDGDGWTAPLLEAVGTDPASSDDPELKNVLSAGRVWRRYVQEHTAARARHNVLCSVNRGVVVHHRDSPARTK